MRVPRPFGGRWRVRTPDAECADWLPEPALAWALALAPGPQTTLVTNSRSSWVLRTSVGSRDLYCKTYIYPTGRDRRRGWLRNTWLAASRAAREAHAMAWLRCHGFLAPRVPLVAELRRCGVLHAALLVTEAIPGVALDRALPGMPAAARAELLDALREFVRELHRQGFRDRNLDLRNLIWLPGSNPPQFAKVDSPRFRLVAPGSGDDALARADWQRLEASIAALD